MFLPAEFHGQRSLAGDSPWSWKESDTTGHTCTHTQYRMKEGFPGVSDGKESACNGGDPGSIPRWGRSPGEVNGYPLQYSCLENSVHKRIWQVTVHGVAKSRA